MSEWNWLFIGGCWAVWAAYWVVMAFSTKRTVERGALVGYRLVAVALILGLLAAAHLVDVSSRDQLWRPTPVLAVAADLIVLAGTAFSIWARVALGGNWSAEVTFKRDHELIQSGPYALARHPIYTGLIAMCLGTVLYYGRVVGFVVLVGACGALWWKARQEERIMSQHFPDAYADYKARVRAIIPFVL